LNPSKIRNKQIYRATNQFRGKQAGSHLSKQLRLKYGQRGVRILNGDTVKVIRGEFKGVDGKVVKVSTAKHTIAIEGIKKQKRKGDKIDVYIDSSNVVITNLNMDDKWRTARLEKKPIEKIKTEKAENETGTKPVKEKEMKKSDPKIKTEKAKNKTKTKPVKEKEMKK
jgi:large subunit ribosomal protein L24